MHLRRAERFASIRSLDEGIEIGLNVCSRALYLRLRAARSGCWQPDWHEPVAGPVGLGVGLAFNKLASGPSSDGPCTDSVSTS
jgi:hypothetical protein